MDSAPSAVSLRTVQQVPRPTFPHLGSSMMPATVLRTNGHPLARMHCNWGVVFLGSKDELQAAGFGVGAIFPGEPDGNKRKAVFPACNGFSKIEARLHDGESWLGEPSQSTLPNYTIDAFYIDDDFRFKREFEPAPDMPGVLLYQDTHSDVYRGTSKALIAAFLIDASQLPGQAGTGKSRTTFTPNGDRVKSGSSASRNHQGKKTIKAVGKLFEVDVRVSAEEYEIRHTDYIEKHRVRDLEKKRKIADHLQKIAMSPTAGQSRTKSHLKLVWSAK